MKCDQISKKDVECKSKIHSKLFIFYGKKVYIMCKLQNHYVILFNN